MSDSQTILAIERLTIASSVRMFASGRFGFTDQTARLTSLTKPDNPVRGLRIM